jgi:hypothetical protein
MKKPLFEGLLGDVGDRSELPNLLREDVEAFKDHYFIFRSKSSRQIQIDLKRSF